jgi:hypothetical protein
MTFKKAAALLADTNVGKILLTKNCKLRDSTRSTAL